MQTSTTTRPSTTTPTYQGHIQAPPPPLFLAGEIQIHCFKLNQYLRVKRSFGYTARVVVLLCLMLWFFQETLAVVFFAYMLSGPVAVLNERAKIQPGEAEDI